MPTNLMWLIFLLPVASFVIVSALIKPFINNESKLPGYVTILAITGSFALSVWALVTVMSAEGHVIDVPAITWLNIGNLTISINMIMDSLTAVMLVVVTFVSLMVQIYSLGYLHRDPVNTVDTGFPRYYAWMSLFTASMLGLIIAGNLLMMFMFWEMVGLCSYLLIGFWFHKPAAANAAKKAFIVTRLGDFGFLAAILLIFANTHTFDTNALRDLAMTGVLAGNVLTWAAIGIFAGAAGKSAQFPLHVWLPDAMEGPTPVSALIHSATMVSAGVFLVARTFPLFVFSTQALTTVAIIGGFTAIFAASMGMVMNDIKRVLAYSTISQLGFMMLGLGASGLGIAHESNLTAEIIRGATAVGIFHLFTHAFFKSLLFLGSGSVNHASGTFDMRKMGGLGKAMPWTCITFVIGSLSLAGIWPLAGFWSKDEILAKAMENQPFLFVLALITVFMTAFYMFRAVFMTFSGEYKGGEVHEPHDAQEKASDHEEHNAHTTQPHESPAIMVLPLVLLSILAIVAGFWNITGAFSAFMGHETESKTIIQGLFGVFTENWLPIASLLVAISGIFMAYVMYSVKWLSPSKIADGFFKPLYILFSRKYYMDELYENIIVSKLLLGGLFKGFQKLDEQVIDGTVNGAGSGTRNSGNVLRKLQNGQLQFYGLFIGIGIVAIAVCLFIFG
ncbi:MAG: NADH-quinone oxidoreductase subunit L [Dehalococcoidales bacterium]|nr:NADH-quinone oxidoreductase subunit L [Dehalococcoidales bacterium]